MAGLFGFDDDVRLGLLTAGLATLAGRGGPMRAAGQGGLLGLNAYTGAKASHKDSEKESLQMDMLRAQVEEFKRRAQEQQRAADEERQRRTGLSQAFQGAMSPGMPQMGPPTAQGEMQAGVAPSFDMMRFAQAAGQVDPAIGLSAVAQARPAQEKSPWAQINPKDYTPESLREYVQTRDPSVLRAPQSPEASPLGKVSPGDFTPASIAKFLKTGDFADLAPIDKRPQTSVTVNNDTGPKLPPNFMWKDPRNPGAGVVPLPGGPADESDRKAARAQSTLDSNDVVLNALREAKKLVGYTTAGAGGAIAGMIPGTPAVDLRKRIDTIKANIGFDRLEAMRDRAKTGGALGQVAVQELAMLQATLGSLDTEQSPAQLKKTLDDIEKHFTRATALLKRIDDEAARGGGRAMSGQIGGSAADPLGIR